MPERAQGSRHRAASIVALLVALSGLMASPSARAQERAMGGIGVTVYADPNFRGTNATFRNDIPNLQSVGLNDRISSLEVAYGEYWEVCEHAYYEGRCQVFSGSESNLRERGWNDVISSLRRVRGGPGGAGGPGRPPTAPPPTARGITLFASQNFSGDRRTFTTAVPDLGRYNFNDRALSLEVAPGDVWEVCRDRNFRTCREVTSNMSSLAQLGMGRQISSLRPRRGPGEGWPGAGAPGRPPGGYVGRVVLFDSRNFRGQSYVVDGVQGSLGRFGARAESIRIEGGTWELCDGANFTGRCLTMRNDSDDLRTQRFANRIRSVRPLPGGAY